MKKIIFLTLFSIAALFGKTETINLTGEYSEQLGNPFKRVLNINKAKTINIYSEDKDVVLKVESNLESGNILPVNQHPDQLILKNKSVENVVEDFYSEDFIVNKNSKDAVVVNVISGTVFLTYSNEDNNSGVQHLMGVEVKLVVSIDGQEKEIVMDQNLFNKDGNYRGTISKDMNFGASGYKKEFKKITENSIFFLLKK